MVFGRFKPSTCEVTAFNKATFSLCVRKRGDIQKPYNHLLGTKGVEMQAPTLPDIWTAAGVVLGFQVTAFLWRIANEVTYARETKNRGVTWLPPADLVNLIAMAVMVLGVFLAPLVIGPSVSPQKWFGLALILFVGHCFALAGHYDLYNPKTKRSMLYFPLQEQVAIGATLVVCIAYIALVFRA
jgi:drug/metabolite transporter (DMT)-like permease